MSHKIELRRLDAVVTWNYDLKNSECICSRHLHLPTANEIASGKVNRNSIVYGKCNHGFHSDCFAQFNKQNKTQKNEGSSSLCPIDKLPWEAANTTAVTKPKYYMC